MRLTCPACGFCADVPNAMLPPEGARTKCAQCERTLVFTRTGLIDDDPTPPEASDAAVERLGNAFAGAADAVLAAKAIEDGPWWVGGDGGQQGPFDLKQVKALIRAGELTTRSYIAVPGTEDWVLAGDVKELKRWFALKGESSAAAAGVAAATGAKAVAGGAAVGLPDAPCFRHPKVRADWNCSKCSTPHCEGCAVKRPMGTLKEVRGCASCDGICAPLVHAKVIVPWWQDMRSVWRYPLQSKVALGLATLTSLLSGFTPLLASIILSLSLLAYYLFILRESAKGSQRLPGLGHVQDIYGELCIPGLKAFIVSLVVIIPVVLQGGHLMFSWLQVQSWDSQQEARAAADERRAAGEDEEQDEADEVDPDNMTEGEFRAWMKQNPDEYQRWALGLPDDDVSDDGSEPEEGELSYWEQREGVDTGREPGERPTGRYVFDILLFLALTVYAIVTWPILLIIVAQFNTILPAFTPHVVFRIIAEIKQEYFAAVLFFAGAYLANVAAPILLRAIGLDSWLWYVPLTAFSVYLAFAAFHVLGRTAEMADQKIDWS